MCGITGSINWQADTVLDAMVEAQRHRGPDDGGTWLTTTATGERVGLGSRRLAILDISTAGHMPMSSADGQQTIVFNGEIYNYRELRQELESCGHQFHSDCDTEVVLHMYLEFGTDCVKRLNGMFAIAIWDEVEQQLFLARDHFGIKPLYYTLANGQFAFASEIKSFLPLPGFRKAINREALHQYLTFLWVPDPLTLFDGVLKMPPGHFGLYKSGQLTLTSYWDLQFPPADHHFEQSEAALTDEVRERFSAVVKSQMVSDVPLGAFLSAGLDSSSILACMKQHTSEPIRTFTVAFPEKYTKGDVRLDDTTVAARTAASFGCIHSEIMVEPNVVDLLPHLIWHMDEPVSDPAIITAYLVNREARQDVTVLLSGVGGDELFGGYRKYQAHELAKRYQKIPAPLRKHLIEPAINALPPLSGSALKSHIRLAKKMVRSGSMEPRERFITDSVYMSEQLVHSLYTEETQALCGQSAPQLRHMEYFDNVQDADFLNQMLYVDTKAFMNSLNLTYNDKMSMASSVEVRVPFLDWEFADWVAQEVPPNLKIKGGTTKHILREAMRPWLPAEVLTQKKAGFFAPIDHWLANDLSDMVNDLLSVAQVEHRGLFRAEQVSRMVQEQQTGKHDWSMQIWQLLTLELWMQAFLD
ncbi:asparagine synthase (glutamine-hydrolyzing) [Granulosicoccus antarcticus]|uniref:asparagine synthase (glutamine-hydrolyzing) n=1 Tax=Granulosicoccus antarcticus IMCC3135 TaxID=1192854 RepID=A0A2Z2NSK8_9GAMM|nr:asparagine synthase (glutamine-hydrolyzing) [Granulosicoccus antarcticus]ASJ74492.1 Asparagine synthetase [glutamine-hydrolyzing] 1 [Granulosicoccus antarcticus IMCC3135]